MRIILLYTKSCFEVYFFLYLENVRTMKMFVHEPSRWLVAQTLIKVMAPNRMLLPHQQIATEHITVQIDFNSSIEPHNGLVNKQVVPTPDSGHTTTSSSIQNVQGRVKCWRGLCTQSIPLNWKWKNDNTKIDRFVSC